MLAKTFHLELSRRVTAYYLVFGLANVVWLAVGVVMILESMENARAEKECLGRLRAAASELRSASVREQPDVQSLVDRFRAEGNLAYCAVVSDDGLFAAHSSPEQVGRPHQVPAGNTARWDDVERTRYVDGESGAMREYRVPVRISGARGVLVMGVPEPGAWGTLLSVAWHAVRPSAEVERQLVRLATAPAGSEAGLTPVKVPSAMGIGWNRLIRSPRDGSGGQELETRLGQALETFREGKLEQILNSLADGVALTDEHGVITFANNSLAGLLGLGACGRALSGKTAEQCLGLEKAPERGAQLLDATLRGRTLVAEIERAGGASQRVLRVARSPLWSAERKAGGGHVWSVRDVTQQKLADRMRDQFVNAATHELRTPMTNIKAFAEMLADSEVTDVDQQKMFCNTINDEVTRLARFVDDLLQLSRMEVGSTALHPKLTDVERLMAEVVRKVQPQMEKKGIAFEVDVPARLPELVVDKDKITVALVNLLGNAAKYTPDGGRVRFHVEVTDTAMRIDVADTGIGISPEELPKVFEKFYRSSDSRVHEETGSGLGLSLAHEIARLHGGKLAAHSELDKGSTFTLTLPLAVEKVECSSA
jgi:PAS domain S-box-containing protein